MSICTDISVCQHSFTCTKKAGHNTTVNIRLLYVVTLLQTKGTTFASFLMLFWVTVYHIKVYCVCCRAFLMSSCIGILTCYCKYLLYHHLFTLVPFFPPLHQSQQVKNTTIRIWYFKIQTHKHAHPIPHCVLWRSKFPGAVIC